MNKRMLNRAAGAALGTLLACLGLTANAQMREPMLSEVRLVNCDAPGTFAEANACNAAKSGVDALRRYVDFTRSTNRLTMDQFANVRFPTTAKLQPGDAETTRLAGNAK